MYLAYLKAGANVCQQPYCRLQCCRARGSFWHAWLDLHHWSAASSFRGRFGRRLYWYSILRSSMPGALKVLVLSGMQPDPGKD